jgi:peptide/nickel transport system permease protein
MTASDEELDSPFQTVSDVEYSTADRLERWFSSSVVAPLRILLSDPRGLFGVATVLFYVLMGTVGVWLIPVPEADGPVLETAFAGGISAIFEPGGWIDFTPFPDLNYPLGTNRYGAGVFERIVHATPAMLKLVLGGAVFSVATGTVLGTFSGYKGGRTDEIIMMFADAVMAIPDLPLIIVLSIVFTPKNPFVVGILISLPRWAGLSRALRSEVLSLREESFVEASRINGLSTPTILRRELIPNLMPYITINFVGAARGVIFASVALYFLRILPLSDLNWGVMMNEAYSDAGALLTWSSAHWIIFPMVTIVGLSFGLIMLGQAADRVFNPRLRARHAQPDDVGE